MSSAPDCRTCGLCCVSPLPTAYGYVEAEDYKGPRPDHWTRDSLYGRVMRQRRDGRCKALKGTVGECVSCAVYDHRPDVCFDYAPDGDACRSVREMWGRPGGARSAAPVPEVWTKNGPSSTAHILPLRVVGRDVVVDHDLVR